VTLPVLDGSFADDPYALYDRLRPVGPVHRVRDDRGAPVWLVLGHAEARQALLDRALVTLPGAARPPVPTDCPHPLALEGPDHARLKGLLAGRLNRTAAERLRPRVERVADTLLDAVLPPSGEARVELLASYAQPLPTLVLYEVLGIPVDGVRVVGPLLRRVTAPDVAAAERLAAWTAFTEHVAAVVAAKREAPGDDLLTDLLEAASSGSVAPQELLGTVRLLLQVGDETIWHVLGNGVLALTERPDLWQALRRDPERVPAAVEELLRHDAPVNAAVLRHAVRDTVVGGAAVRAGESVLVALTAGSRDPARYGCPAEVDLSRESSQALGFGVGAHYCVGAALARVQCEVALRRLLARCAAVRLAVPRQALRRRPVPLLHGWEELPLLLEVDPALGP
jgi:cytochrome P450